MYMFLRIRIDGSMPRKRKNVCALHRITYLTAAVAAAAPASAADNQKGYATMQGVISRAGAKCGVRNQSALL